MKVYRKKRHLLLLVILILISVIVATPLRERVYVFSIAALQGSSVELSNNRIHLGLGHIYVEIDDNMIEILRIKPGFAGLDEDDYLSFHIALARHIEDFKKHCTIRPDTCEVRGGGSYKVATIKLKRPVGPNFPNYNTFFNEKCNVYVSHFGEAYGNIHGKFIDRFFKENCK